MRPRLVPIGDRKKRPESAYNTAFGAEKGVPRTEHRNHRGWTAQAIGRDVGPKGGDGAICRYCGEVGHHPLDCVRPIRRGWGWPGWEDERANVSSDSSYERAAIGSPKSSKQTRMASLACATVKTGVKRAKLTRSRPKRRRSSSGTPENPQ